MGDVKCPGCEDGHHRGLNELAPGLWWCSECGAYRRDRDDLRFADVPAHRPAEITRLRARVAELEGALALVPREWWAQIEEAEGVAIPAIADLFAPQGGGEGDG